MLRGFTVCEFREKHVDEAEALEKLCFSEPWSRASLEMMMKPPFSGVACETEDGVLAGYGAMILSGDEGEIANLATSPDFRRRGIARELLRTMIGTLRSGGARNVYLEVRESNVPAARLYMSEGFIPVGIRKNYYDKPRENAILMRLSPED